MCSIPLPHDLCRAVNLVLGSLKKTESGYDSAAIVSRKTLTASVSRLKIHEESLQNESKLIICIFHRKADVFVAAL